MKVSVIVPWHEAERWWGACEASLRRSLARAEGLPCEWELVVMRDDDARGVAWARNEGLARATGDWISWVDADDEVADDWARVLASTLAAHPDADAVIFDHDDGARDVSRWGRRAGEVSARVFRRDLLGDRRQKSYLWNKVCRRALFEARPFCEDLRAFEDYDFWTRHVARVRRVVYLPAVLYHHHCRPGSLFARENGSAAWVRCAWARAVAARGAPWTLGALAFALYHNLRVNGRWKGRRGA